jgi:hypothetical protein
MAYTTASAVAARDPGRTISATSRPNLDQVTDFITEAAAELDGILRSRGYSTPVPTSATSAFQLLKAYNSLGANCAVERVAVSSSKEKTACEAWEAAKQMLRDGSIELDAPKDPGQSSVRGRAGFPATAMFRRGDEP